MSKVVFVGNVPYNMAEEELIKVFRPVGQVVGFRLVYDRDTGKPKGYGFCEFADTETAASAVRNLNNVDVGGRQLRIDLADSDPFLEGKTTVRGELVDGPGRNEAKKPDFLSNLPPGISLPPGVSCLDAITQTVATMESKHSIEVLAQMKAFVITHPDAAKRLLSAHPQFAYALFQSLILNKIIDPSILYKMLEATKPQGAAVPQGVPPQSAPPPQASYPPPAGQYTATMAAPQPVQGVTPPQMVPQPGMYPPPPMPQPGPPPTFYGNPPMGMAAPPAPAPVPPPALPSSNPILTPPQSNVSPSISDTQKAMLLQVFNMTPEQISALPESERNAIHQLRAQFMGAV